MLDLAEQSCVAYKKGHAALNSSSANNLLAKLKGWSLNPASSTLYQTFKFDNYYQTIAFVNVIAQIAHLQDHHPRLNVSYNSCHVEFSTHTVAGLSLNDFICAAKIDKLTQLCQSQHQKKMVEEKSEPITPSAATPESDNDHGRSYPTLQFDRRDLVEKNTIPQIKMEENDITLEELVATDRPITLDEPKVATENKSQSAISSHETEDEAEDESGTGDETELMTLGEARLYNPLITETPKTSRLPNNDDDDKTLTISMADIMKETKQADPTKAPQKKPWPPVLEDNFNDEDDTVTMSAELFKQKKKP